MAIATVFIGLGSRNECFIFGSAAVIHAGAGTDYVEIDGMLAGILYGQGGADILVGWICERRQGRRSRGRNIRRDRAGRHDPVSALRRLWREAVLGRSAAGA